jgi:23S rRNA (guanosine2251-2'-O)-methyltransferase
MLKYDYCKGCDYMAIIITGKNTVLEAIKANRKIHELYIQKGSNKDVFEIARKSRLKVVELDKKEITDKLPKNNQGIGALVEEYKYVELDTVLNKDKQNKVFVMLDQLEDPHNLGAILRTADAFSVDAIIIPKNRSVKLNATVAKVSTGAIEHVNVVEVTNLTNTIKTLKDNGFWVAGTDADTEQTISDINVDTNLCIVIGSEGKGISRLVKENCDYMVKIPMSGHVNSLNASVSAALVIYEVYRKKGW